MRSIAALGSMSAINSKRAPQRGQASTSKLAPSAAIDDERLIEQDTRRGRHAAENRTAA